MARISLLLTPNRAPPNSRKNGDSRRQHGVDAGVTIAPGLPHDILLEPAALEELRKLLQSMERPPQG